MLTSLTPNSRASSDSVHGTESESTRSRICFTCSGVRVFLRGIRPGTRSSISSSSGVHSLAARLSVDAEDAGAVLGCGVLVGAVGPVTVVGDITLEVSCREPMRCRRAAGFTGQPPPRYAEILERDHATSSSISGSPFGQPRGGWAWRNDAALPGMAMG